MIRGRLRQCWPVVATAATVLAAGGCSTLSATPPTEVPDGDPGRGAQLVTRYGCGSCHSVPGIRGADGLVGPPLTRFGSRSYIAGKLVNNGTNLEHWIRDPQEVEPGTAMPDLGVPPDDAKDIAAYLFTLD
ncbi:hypothetical protein GCM10009682_23460 [Luedemannella flava]|uniref:Cytochrome c domain-containing protein n=1 Tax=Luedemannella flava TaxID=349316 RepID=A0ABP4Y6T2_9ACTN